MIKVKTNVPIVNMDEQTYKLSDFVEEFKKIELKELKTENKVNNLPNDILIRNKKGILHYSTKNPFCPSCGSRLVSKHSIHSRKLYFYDKGEVKVHLDRYKCDKCGKTFNTDMNSIVEKNSNYTLDFIEKVLDLVGIFYGSLRSIAYKVKKDTGIDISIQTIENWILNVEDPNKGKINRYSGYYLFDSEWGKFNGDWCYRFSLFDVKYNTLVADKFYSDEITKNVQEFLEQSTFNQERIAITSDLKEEYKPIIEKLGFKHQWCEVHSKKNINKIIKDYLSENEVSDNEKELIKIHKRDIFNLFKSKSYEEARNKFDKMLDIIDEYPAVIQDILLNKIMPYFKTYFLFLIDGKVERTTNKIENLFLKTFPRHVKKIMKTFKGAMGRIWLRQIIWDQKNMIQK